MRQAAAGDGATAATSQEMLFDDDLDMPAPTAAVPGRCKAASEMLSPIKTICLLCSCNMLRRYAFQALSNTASWCRPATAGGGAAPGLATGCRMGCICALAVLAPAQPDVAFEALAELLGAALDAEVAPPEGLIHTLAEALCTAACASG